MKVLKEYAQLNKPSDSKFILLNFFIEFVITDEQIDLSLLEKILIGFQRQENCKDN